MWIVYAIIGAALKAVQALLQKDVAGKIDGRLFAWIGASFAIPLILVSAQFGDNDPVGTLQNHWLEGFITALTWNAAVIFGIAALKREQMSYIAPLAAFIPVFSLIMGWLFIGERIPTSGFVGVSTVFIGGYIINLRSTQVRWHEPVTHIFKNSGARFSIGAAAVLALNNVITKGVLNDGVTALDWMFAINMFAWLQLSYIPLTRMPEIKKAFQSHMKLLTSVALVGFLSGLFAILAVAGTATSFALSVRRLDIIFSILLGWRFLKETDIRNKLIGSGLMIAGIVLIAAS